MQKFRPTLTASAVALAFATDATAAGLADDPRAKLRYTPALINAIDAVTDDPAVQSRARGFMVELEKALKERGGAAKFVDYPPRANAELLRVLAVVPPKGLEYLPIPVCAEQFNKVLGTWNITVNGEVVPAPWDGPKVSEQPDSSACKAFIFAARADINQKLAEMNSGKPTPYSAPPPAAKPQAATPQPAAPPASAGTSPPSAAVTSGTQIRMITGRSPSREL